MLKKLHPADIADRAAVAGAVGFTSISGSRPSTRSMSPLAASLTLVQKADKMRARYPTKRPLVYALTALGASTLVPNDMLITARKSLVEA